MSRKQKKVTLRLILAAVLTALVWLLSAKGLISSWFFLVPYLVIGYDVLWSAARNVVHGQVFDEQFLMTIATLGAFATAEHVEAVAVMLFYQLGELFQSIAVGRSRKSIAALMDIRPDYAVVLRNGEETEVSPEEVELGEVLLIKPGEKIPLDGKVLEGTTAVNTAALTGESLPVDKEPGDTVISGSINLTGVIKMRAESRYEESTVAKILELVENSAEKKAKTEAFITRFARYYTPCVVIGALLLAVLPPLLFGQEWNAWIHRGLIFLVVSCPCALVVSVPMSFFGGIGGASRQGILIKGSNYLETLAKVNTLVFDKTGTLTEGKFAVETVKAVGMTETELLQMAAAAESYSEHPVAESIALAGKLAAEKASAEEKEGAFAELRSRVKEVQELAGKGLRAVIDGKAWCFGNSKLMQQQGISLPEIQEPGTVVHCACDGEYRGYILVSDRIKPDSQKALADLKALGIRETVMLTGDSDVAAKAAGRQLGVDRIYSQLLPAQKVEQVEALLAEGRRVAFVGDGINDAPVLARADVGIAMGAMGSDAAIESADIVLMDDKLSKLPAAIRLARKTMAIVKQNIWFALLVKGVILLLSAFGYANMWMAVFGDVGVMVIAILNAMRILVTKRKEG